MANAETDVSFNQLPELNRNRTEPEQVEVERSNGSGALKDAVEPENSGVGLDGAQAPNALKSDHGRCYSPSLTSRFSTCGSTRALGKLLDQDGR